MSKKYDVVIVGAGIGGLVAGCYLSKAGLKVLMIEQHHSPGGYCTSFVRSGYHFDAGVHYLGGIRNGSLGVIIRELGIAKKIGLSRFDPTDKIIMPDNTTYIRKNPKDTVKEFQKSFPKEKQAIRDFFNFILQKNFYNIYNECKNIDFNSVSDKFFKDRKIKATLETLLSNIGISGNRFSAISSIILYRDYILDGGYYPKKGMQGFSDVLADAFRKFGGDLLLSKKVSKILTKNDNIIGVVIANNKKILAKYVISNCDAKQTFKVLVDSRTNTEREIINKLTFSPSIFAVYLGVKGDISAITRENCNMWHFNTYDISECFDNLEKSISKNNLPYIMLSFPSSHTKDPIRNSKSTIQLFLISPFISAEFWENNRDIIGQKLIRKACDLLPGLENKIEVNINATPKTFYKYTLNYNGAAFGWESTIKQTNPSVFPQRTSINGLFLAGHWCTIGSGQGGVPKVALSGAKAAKLILRDNLSHKKT